MFQAYKYTAYPTIEQQQQLSRAFGCCRWIYNYALNLKNETYETTGKSLSWIKVANLLPTLKKEHPWLGTDIYSQCLQQSIKYLETAFKNFFEKRAARPKFKSKHGKQAISFPQNVKQQGDYFKIPKLGLLYCKVDRSPVGKIKTVTVTKNPDGKYYISVLVDDGKDEPETSSEGKAVGIDLGLKHFAITSDGQKFDNPLHFIKHQRNLKRKQQKLSRAVKGSYTRAKTKLKVAKVHSKIARCRADFLHKLSRFLVDENQVIIVENLHVKGMVRNRKLARSISDVGWGMFQTMLSYKAKRQGKVYQEVDRFFASSKTCHVCNYKLDSIGLDVREWQCPSCHTAHDRDLNAAIMIKIEGLRIISSGTGDKASSADIRPETGSPVEGGLRKVDLVNHFSTIDSETLPFRAE